MENLKIRRNKMNVTILILIVFAFVLAANIINFWPTATRFNLPEEVFNTTTNQSSIIEIFFHQGCASSQSIQFGQDLIKSLMQPCVPFFIMLVLNVLLIRKIRCAKKRAAKLFTSSRQQPTSKVVAEKRELHFAMSVLFINFSYLILNTPFVAMMTYGYITKFQSVQRDMYSQNLFVLCTTVSLYSSFLFTLLEFWRDLALNRLFRHEVWTFLRLDRCRKCHASSSQ